MWRPIRSPGVFSALADPTRRDIVARLTVADATVNELAEPWTPSRGATPSWPAAWRRASVQGYQCLDGVLAAG